MRILLGIQRLWRGGGTETHVITLADSLRKMGHEVVVYTSGGEWVDKVRRYGITIQTDVSMLNRKNRSSSQVKLGQYLRHRRFDVMHAHDATTLRLFSHAIKAMQHRPKLIFTVHGPYVRRTVISDAEKQASAIIAVSSEIRKSLLKTVSQRKLHMVRNGIRSDVFYPASGRVFRKVHGIPQDAFVVAYCGRFTFDKITLGKRIVEALRTFSSNNSGTHIVIAGRGAKDMFVTAERVHILGHVEQMQSFINSCDVLIATGRTAVESLFCKVPVVTIGKAGYHGPITMNSLRRMLVSNFGDHGTPRTWTSEKLHRDLRLIRQRHRMFRGETEKVRQVVKRKLSAKHMASRIERIYRAH